MAAGGYAIIGATEDSESVCGGDSREEPVALAILDAHADTLNVLRREGRDFLSHSGLGQADLPRLLSGGVRWQVLAICAAGERLTGGEATLHALEQIALFQGICRRSAGRVHLARTVAELDVPEGHFAGMLSFEGAEPLCADPFLYDLFHALGVRILSLTWNGVNDLGAGIGGQGGLTRQGREFLTVLAAKPLVLDIAHLGPQTVEDVLDSWSRPLIASHANVRALCPHPRNLTDEQIDAVAGTGGVIGLTFVPMFLNASGQADLTDIVRHVVYLADRVGTAHIGFGSDFDGGLTELVGGLRTADQYGNLFEALREAGFSEDELEQMAHRNWRRVFAANLDEVARP
jgi:membrane dipeptidase